MRTVDWLETALPARLPAALTVALYGLHPATIAALRGDASGKLVACLTGIAAGIVICRWKPALWWHRWAVLLPAIPCILLDRAGVGFAPLCVASVWFFSGDTGGESRRRSVLECWPCLIVSLAAGVLHREGGFDPGASIASIPAIAGSFMAPFAPSMSAGWSIADGLACFAGAGATIVACAGVFGLPAISFGLTWFLVMALLTPTEPLAPLPGLALATISSLATASKRFLAGQPAWLKADV